VLLYNAGSGTFGTITEITPISTNRLAGQCFRGVYRSQGTAPPPPPPPPPRYDCTRPRNNASSRAQRRRESRAEIGFVWNRRKFAMRGLAQSLARDLGPRGIHVAWINVDGSIDIPGARGLKPSLQDGDFSKPDAIAETTGISRTRIRVRGRWN